jgi:hypothetical protein
VLLFGALLYALAAVAIGLFSAVIRIQMLDRKQAAE